MPCGSPLAPPGDDGDHSALSYIVPIEYTIPLGILEPSHYDPYIPRHLDVMCSETFGFRMI